MTGTVFQIQRYCIHDGTGIRTCVFLKGCPLHCPWCHNPEGISPKIQSDSLGKRYGAVMTAEQVYAEIVKDKIYYDLSDGGVTLSGGEPFYQAEFMSCAAKLIKDGGISVAVETGGAATKSGIEMVLPYIDGVLFDIKSFDGEKLWSTVGADIHTVERSLGIFVSAGVSITLRSTVISGFNDEGEHFIKLGELAARINAAAVELLAYHSLGVDKRKRLNMEAKEFAEIDREKMSRAVELVKKNFPYVSV